MDQSQRANRSSRLRRSGVAGLLLIACTALLLSASPVQSGSLITPTPMFIDRLATPVVPENPTPSDLGRQVYYLHCMPCHGDVGQGLTDEWRSKWVPDHQDCWQAKCHSYSHPQDGFMIPRWAPPLVGDSMYCISDLSGRLSLYRMEAQPGGSELHLALNGEAVLTQLELVDRAP
ncbi:MAG: hypothetical protein HGB05_09120 [Chloroflexi bacterium]|nr:hypothetical protein [Chloroflexota bacterium]